MLPSRVVIDACVLYDAAVRDLLLRLGLAGLIEPVWSARILDECFAALRRNRPDITEEQHDRLRAALTRAFPRAAIPPASVDVALPDPDDVHVVGTAFAAHALAIVTYNLSDFPAESLATAGLHAVHPDTLTTELLRSDPGTVVAVLVEHAQALRRPPTTMDRLLATLDARGLRASAAAAREELARRG
jgi:hypothetical protein